MLTIFIDRVKRASLKDWKTKLLHILGGTFFIGIKFGCINSLVEASLKARHLTLDDVLNLVGQLRFNVLFETSKQEGPKDLVQTTNNEDSFLFVQFHFLASDGEGCIEPLLKRVTRLEDGRQ